MNYVYYSAATSAVLRLKGNTSAWWGSTYKSTTMPKDDFKDAFSSAHSPSPTDLATAHGTSPPIPTIIRQHSDICGSDREEDSSPSDREEGSSPSDLEEDSSDGDREEGLSLGDESSSRSLGEELSSRSL
ncbi:hypothetical protein DFQ27_009776, partial [Actinomortierella ambigua]